MVTGQVIALGRVHAGKTVTMHVHDTHLIAECDDGRAPSNGLPTNPSATSKPTRTPSNP
jgi:hypothetical protein